MPALTDLARHYKNELVGFDTELDQGLLQEAWCSPVKPSDRPRESSNISVSTGKLVWLRWAMKVSKAVLTAYWELSGAKREASTS